MNEEKEVQNINPQESVIQPEQTDSKGPIVGAVIVLIIIVAGGLYIWTSRTPSSSETEANAILTAPDEILENLETQGVGDTVSEIEKDVNETDLTGLDEELSDLERELNEAL